MIPSAKCRRKNCNPFGPGGVPGNVTIFCRNSMIRQTTEKISCPQSLRLLRTIVHLEKLLIRSGKCLGSTSECLLCQRLKKIIPLSRDDQESKGRFTLVF